MPRKEPKLVKFLKKALDEDLENVERGKSKKYENLFYENFLKKDVFSLLLPHKTDRLDIKYEFILKSWYAINGRKYRLKKNYSEAKQAMTQSLRKSDYVNMDMYDNKLRCRILSNEEVKEKKRLRQELKKLKAEQKNFENVSSNESDYDSGFNSPENFVDFEQNDTDVLEVVQLDHSYALSPPERTSREVNGFHDDIENNFNEDEVFDEIKSIRMDAYMIEDFSDIPGISERNTLEDLMSIPNEQFVRGNFMESPLASQVPVKNGAKTKNKVKSFVCQQYEFVDNSIVLMCKLFKEMDVDIADNYGNIRIIYEDTVQNILQEYSYLKDTLLIDDNYLVVIFEPPLIR